MLDNNRLALAFLAIVLIASGCSQTGTDDFDSGTASVTIENFSANPSQPYSTQPVNLMMQIKNNGDEDARDVQVEIFNVPFADEDDSDTGDSSWTLRDPRWQKEGELRAADEQENLPARTNTVRWSLDAPNIEDGLSIPYEFKTRLYYNYTTTATSSVVLMSRNRYRQEGALERPTIQNSAAPIKTEIRTRSPLLYDEKAEMCVIVEDNGQGTPFLYDEATSGDNYDLNENTGEDGERSITDKVYLEVSEAPGVTIDPETDDSTDFGVPVVLINGRGVQCYKITVDNDEDGQLSGQERLEVPLQMKAHYGYVKDGSTTIEVTGSDRFQ